MATRPPTRSSRTSKSAARAQQAGSTSESPSPATQAEGSGPAPRSTPTSPAEVTGTSLERREIPSFSVSREARIAEAAYWRAERRGFEAGHELDDWLEAEKEIDDQLAREADRERNGREGGQRDAR